MGHSSLLGTDLAAAEPAGRDNASLGPGDTSDSGSDMAFLDQELEDGDPNVPVDVALREGNQRAGMSGDSLGGAASDASGTGERRSAGADAGRREAADISTDRIFTPGREGAEDDDEEDPDLAFVDRAEAGAALEDEDEDDEIPGGAEAVRNTRQSTSAVAAANPHQPGRPNPEPDGPDPILPEDEDDIPKDDGDDEDKAPGRS